MLSSILNYENMKYYNIVVFTNKGSLKQVHVTSKNTRVILLDDLKMTIKNIEESIQSEFYPSEMKNIREMIDFFDKSSDKDRVQEHVDFLKERHSNDN